MINGNTLGEAELESQLGEKRSCSRSLDEQILPNSLILRPNFWVIMSEQNVCLCCSISSRGEGWSCSADCWPLLGKLNDGVTPPTTEDRMDNNLLCRQIFTLVELALIYSLENDK